MKRKPIGDIAKDEARAESRRCGGCLTDKERQILEMWPRYEDTGDCVMPGDRVALEDGSAEVLCQLHIGESCYSLYTETHDEEHPCGERVKRPARVVLDADGVRIREGDTVWIIPALTDTPDEPHEVIGINRWGEVLLEFHTEGSTGLKGEYLTHARPDSWERLEEDAGDNPFTYCKAAGIHLYTFDNSERAKSRDIIRRAKALAGVEVDK